MRIRIIRNVVLCVIWVVFVLSLPIYVFWAVFNYSHLCAWEAKFCGFFKQIVNKKTNTKTTKGEMMQFLRELQNLQQWLHNSSHEITLDINFCVFENSTAIYGYVSLFSDIGGMSESVNLYSISSYEENRKQLNYFVKYVKKLAKYGLKKSESN